ncbi:MAG: hypothetical protein ACE5HV_00815 [Acidobacteriota bacterium]
MPESSYATSDRKAILSTLRGVDRRMRLNRGLEDLTRGVCVLLLALLGLRLLRWLLSVGRPSLWAIGGIWLAGLCFFLVWDLHRHRALARAAGIADKRGDLKDELKTAYWFLRGGEPSPWVQLLVRRAAGTAAALAPERLVPTLVPRSFPLALGLSALVGVFLWLPLDGPDPALATPAASPHSLTEDESERAQEVQELLERAELLEESGQADTERRSLSAEAHDRLAEALRQLEEGELTMQELVSELQATRNGLDEGNLDRSALEEGLQELGNDLEGSEELRELAEALQSKQMEEATELLRQLAEKLSGLEEQKDIKNLMEGLQGASSPDESELKELMEALKKASEALGDRDTAEAERALQGAADAMQSLAERMRAQELMNQAAERLKKLGGSMAQRPASQQIQVDPSQQIAQEMAGQAQQEGEAGHAGMALPSDDVRWQNGAADQGKPPDQRQGGPAGHASGDPLGGQARLGQPTRLDVQLQMEILGGEKQEPEEEKPEDIFQENSRQQRSVLDYREIRQRSSYAEEDVLSIERIPWQYRKLVRSYFLSLRPREGHDH